MIRVAPLVPFALVLVALVGCSKPQPPEKDRPPEPTATSTVAQQPSALREYMQAPIEKAKTTEDTVLDAAKEQRAAIDAQTSGNSGSETPPAY